MIEFNRGPRWLSISTHGWKQLIFGASAILLAGCSALEPPPVREAEEIPTQAQNIPTTSASPTAASATSASASPTSSATSASTSTASTSTDGESTDVAARGTSSVQTTGGTTDSEPAPARPGELGGLLEPVPADDVNLFGLPVVGDATIEDPAEAGKDALFKEALWQTSALFLGQRNDQLYLFSNEEDRPEFSVVRPDGSGVWSREVPDLLDENGDLEQYHVVARGGGFVLSRVMDIPEDSADLAKAGSRAEIWWITADSAQRLKIEGEEAIWIPDSPEPVDNWEAVDGGLRNGEDKAWQVVAGKQGTPTVRSVPVNEYLMLNGEATPSGHVGTSPVMGWVSGQTDSSKTLTVTSEEMGSMSAKFADSYSGRASVLMGPWVEIDAGASERKLMNLSTKQTMSLPEGCNAKVGDDGVTSPNGRYLVSEHLLLDGKTGDAQCLKETGEQYGVDLAFVTDAGLAYGYASSTDRWVTVQPKGSPKVIPYTDQGSASRSVSVADGVVLQVLPHSGPTVAWSLTDPAAE